MSITEHKRIQFVSDTLVEQIIRNEKTASVTCVEDVNIADGDYDDPLVVGEYYDVYDSNLKKRTAIRIIAMELCTWNNIPERLWKGETNKNSDEFKADHIEYFNNPADNFEFIAYYFERTSF